MTFSLDDPGAYDDKPFDVSADVSPDTAFDQRWALEQIERSLRQEIGQTLASPDQIDEELRHLRQALLGDPPAQHLPGP